MTDLAALGQLIDDTEQQLAAALDAAKAGSLLDLADLVPRLERVCTLAVSLRATEAAPRLAALVDRLDALELLLRERLAETRSDPARAAALYRAASPEDGTG